MINYTLAALVLARGNLFRVLRIIWQHGGKAGWKLIQTADLVVLASDTHEVTVSDLVPAIVRYVSPFWPWLVVALSVLAPFSPVGVF